MSPFINENTDECWWQNVPKSQIRQKKYIVVVLIIAALERLIVCHHNFSLLYNSLQTACENAWYAFFSSFGVIFSMCVRMTQRNREKLKLHMISVSRPRKTCRELKLTKRFNSNCCYTVPIHFSPSLYIYMASLSRFQQQQCNIFFVYFQVCRRIFKHRFFSHHNHLLPRLPATMLRVPLPDSRSFIILSLLWYLSGNVYDNVVCISISTTKQTCASISTATFGVCFFVVLSSSLVSLWFWYCYFRYLHSPHIIRDLRNGNVWVHTFPSFSPSFVCFSRSARTLSFILTWLSFSASKWV